ncbi:MAG TPA: efflux RND transporter periplasmic adaptor subunit [Acidisarcina sp.]
MLGASGCERKDTIPGAAPLPVSTVTAQSVDVSLGGEWVGTLDGDVNAQIQPQVGGYLVRQLYREGSVVQKGQVLFQIDPRPFQALLDQAQGQVDQAKGSLGQAEAQLGLAKINVNRDTPLVDERAIAQSQLDTEKQQAAQQEANVRTAQASISAAQAVVESARLNLGFTQVRSLISGVAGRATTQIGNLVNPQSVLTSVSQMDPIKVYFSVSDGEYLALIKQVTGGGNDFLKSASAVPLSLKLADGSRFSHPGRIVYVDRQMNQQTGAIQIAAVFPNPGNMLRPGQFGRVSANTQIRRNAIVVPQVAIVDLQGQKQVYTVGADNKVHVVNVSVGPETGPNIVILQGLQAGTRVVTDNLQKLSEGATVASHAESATTPIASAHSGANGDL